MTQAKDWRPEKGSLVTLKGFGASGVVTKAEYQKGSSRDSDFFKIRLVDALYFDGNKVAEKEGFIGVGYVPMWSDLVKVYIDVYDEQGVAQYGKALWTWTTTETARRGEGLLARHPNDGAPPTERFAFNHWVCWDDGKHEGHDPEWRGGYNYPERQGTQPCVNVKVNETDKLVRDRERVQEQIGELTDAQWSRYLEWVDERAEQQAAFDDFDRALEDARSGLEDVLERTGLEYAFGGRSGGYLCITNGPSEEIWELKELSEKEEERLDELSGQSTLTKAEDEEWEDLNHRSESAWCDGDKAVIRAALHQIGETAENEVAYHFMALQAHAFSEVLEDEKEEAAEREIDSAKDDALKLLEDVRTLLCENELLGDAETEADRIRAEIEIVLRRAGKLEE